jgi:DHA1 family tetracycline resistance protein-like MFS transporter
MTPPESQGEMLGIQQSITSLAFIFPPLIAGVMVSLDYRLPIVLSAIILFLAWANFYFRFNDKKLTVAK